MIFQVVIHPVLVLFPIVTLTWLYILISSLLKLRKDGDKNNSTN